MVVLQQIQPLASFAIHVHLPRLKADAYQRTGGTADLKRQIEGSASSPDLKKQIDALLAMTDSLREKTADALDRLEKAIRKTEKGE